MLAFSSCRRAPTTFTIGSRKYLALEASSNVKHEYLDGQIYAMAGQTPVHAALAAALLGQLYAQLRAGRCRAYDADLRVRVPETGLVTYPDAAVIGGRVERAADDPTAAVNPTVLVEVLRDSTERYDLGVKFEHYKRLAALTQYVLVSQRERSVEVWTRGESGWTRATSADGDLAQLGSIGASLDVRELYDAAAEPSA